MHASWAVTLVACIVQRWAAGLGQGKGYLQSPGWCQLRLALTRDRAVLQQPRALLFNLYIITHADHLHSRTVQLIGEGACPLTGGSQWGHRRRG